MTGLPERQSGEPRLSAYECNVIGTDWQRVINARSAGRAKSEYWRDVTESWPSIPFTAIRVRVVGPPQSSEEFIRCAAYRGLPKVRCGTRVKVGEDFGVIVGHNGSANFDVLFDASSPRFGDQVLNVHPSEIEVQS